MVCPALAEARNQYLLIRGSSTVIEQLMLYARQDESVGLAYFYFDFNNIQQQAMESVIRSLIAQLCLQCSTIPTGVTKLYDSRFDGRVAIDESAFLLALRSILFLFDNVYIVLDALDECINLDEVVALLQTLRGYEIPQLHLLASSRQLAVIEKSLAPFATVNICLNNIEYNTDIQDYLTDRINHDKKFFSWPPAIRHQVINTLVKGEAGM